MRGSMEGIKKEGMDIAKELGNGVRYVGPQMSDGKLIFHWFNDNAVTGGSFAAKTIKEAKKNLTEKRRLFKAPPPNFPSL